MADERNREGESLPSRLPTCAVRRTDSAEVAAPGGNEPNAEETSDDSDAAPAMVSDEKRGNGALPGRLTWRMPPVGILPSEESTSANSERAAGDHTATTSADSNVAANWAAKCGLTGDDERCSNGWSMRALLDEFIVDAVEDSSGDDEASENEFPPIRKLLLLLMLAWPPLPLFESALRAAAIALFA